MKSLTQQDFPSIGPGDLFDLSEPQVFITLQINFNMSPTALEEIKQ